MNYHITIIIECISILFLNMVLWSLMLPHVAPCCPQIAKMIGRCEAEASGWRGRDPHISLVPRCANPLWANLTKRCIQYTLTRTHIDIHTHIVYLYIHRCITYVQFIMNYMRIYRIFLLKACCMTFIEPGDFHRTISRDMARHANAMRMPMQEPSRFDVEAFDGLLQQGRSALDAEERRSSAEASLGVKDVPWIWES